MSKRKPAKFVVRCADYNGLKDVLFMMAADDFRFDNGNYTPVAEGTYSRRDATITTAEGVYRVFPDWSLRRVAS